MEGKSGYPSMGSIGTVKLINKEPGKSGFFAIIMFAI